MEEKSVDFNKLNFSHTDLESIFQQRLSYQKAFKEINRSIPTMSSSPNGEKYANVILLLESRGSLAEFDELVDLIRSIYDSEMRRLKLSSSSFGEDDSWIHWDLAKQLYFFLSKDRSTTNNHYRIADPLNDETLRAEIISRHIGWEFWRSGGCEPWISKSEVRRLLEQGEKQPPSWALAQLGALIRSS